MGLLRIEVAGDLFSTEGRSKNEVGRSGVECHKVGEVKCRGVS
jgi:hypothetical protein